MQDFWDTIKKTNLQIISIEIKEIQTKDKDNLFNNTVAKISQSQKREEHPGKEAFRMSNRQDQKRNTSRHISKTLNIQNKEF
jgi:hypothetical protein